MKVGLKDTLTLLSKGYTKKEIDALAAQDEQPEPQPDPEPEPQPEPKPDPEPEPQPEPEPDYKKLYEELKKQSEEDKAKITKLQQTNVHTNNAPAAADAKKQESDALVNLVRSYM